tara:strand:+ start:825 stop:1223 length:399 start_codon:yes stop_codon:yes gene_type:complete
MSKKTQKYWKNKIDKVFHEYIRRRDVDNNTGYCNCITCDKTIHFSETDAGHFISRQYLSTRYDESNVFAQCRKCNRFEYGRQYEYSLKLGKEKSEQLLSKSKEIFKPSQGEWQNLFETFNKKLKQIKKIQNF